MPLASAQKHTRMSPAAAASTLGATWSVALAMSWSATLGVVPRSVTIAAAACTPLAMAYDAGSLLAVLEYAQERVSPTVLDASNDHPLDARFGSVLLARRATKASMMSPS